MTQQTPRRIVHYFLVRHLSYKAVMAHALIRDDDTLRLIRVTPVDGPVPDLTGLLGAVFPDKSAVRVALTERLRRLPGLGKGLDVIGNVLLTCSAWQRWQDVLSTEVPHLTEKDRARLGVQANVNNDGSLTLFVEMEGSDEEVYLDLPQNEWRWNEIRDR